MKRGEGKRWRTVACKGDGGRVPHKFTSVFSFSLPRIPVQIRCMLDGQSCIVYTLVSH